MEIKNREDLCSLVRKCGGIYSTDIYNVVWGEEFQSIDSVALLIRQLPECISTEVHSREDDWNVYDVKMYLPKTKQWGYK